MGFFAERRRRLEGEVLDALGKVDEKVETDNVANQIGESRRSLSPKGKRKNPSWKKVDSTLWRLHKEDLVEREQFSTSRATKSEGVLLIQFYDLSKWSLTPEPTTPHHGTSRGYHKR